MLDSDNQPHPNFNAFRRSDRAINELIGVARGLMADDILTGPEIQLLVDWLEANKEVCAYFPGSVLAQRLDRIIADGIVTAEEAVELEETLQEIIGGTGVGMATTLPLSNPAPVIEFEGMTFCFTGKFVYGPRRICEEAVVRRGAPCAGSVSRKVDYLVIGTVGSRDWVHSSFGRKIEEAVQIRDDGYALAIISEDHWTAAIP